MSKTYELGEKVYVQPRVVMGQINLLAPILTEIEIGGDTNPVQLIVAIGERLPEALAIILVERDMPVREAMQDANLAARIEDLAWSLTPETALEVITDFFELNAISSIGARIAEAIQALRAKMQGTVTSNMPSMSSPEETLTTEGMSFGKFRPGPPLSGSESGQSDAGKSTSGIL